MKNVLDNNGDLSIVQSRKDLSHGYWDYAKNFTYNSTGAVTSMQLGNGKWESTQFNSRLQPTQIAVGTTSGAVNFLKLNFSYGTTENNGNVQSQTITVPTIGVNPGFTATQFYEYDSVNRLKSAEESISSIQTWKQAFLFDRFGNRNFDEAETTTLAKNCIESSVPVMCNADRKIYNPAINPNNNRLSTDDDYSFDTSGSMTGDPQGRTFIYDGERKQVEVKNSTNDTIGKYFYDGNGRRVKKNVPGSDEVTIFAYDASGRLSAEYSTIVAEPAEAKVSYMTSDHLGSPRILTDENGEIISRRDFMPYGEEIYTTERTQGLGYKPDDLRQKFTTYERDEETDLDFAQARMYANKLGRFSSVDPIILTDYRLLNPQALNLYSYVANTPLKFTDPTGKDIRFKNLEDAEQGLTYYRNGLEEDQQKYVDIVKNKDGSYSLTVDEKAGKADGFSLLGRLYKAAVATDIAEISFNKREDKISITVISSEGKPQTETSSLKEMKLDGLTLLPFESKDKAVPKDSAPKGFSTKPNTSQLIIGTNGSYTPTQVIFAETLAHFGEFVRTGNPAAATHAITTVTIIEDQVVDESRENEVNNSRAKPSTIKKPN